MKSIISQLIKYFRLLSTVFILQKLREWKVIQTASKPYGECFESTYLCCLKYWRIWSNLWIICTIPHISLYTLQHISAFITSSSFVEAHENERYNIRKRNVHKFYTSYWQLKLHISERPKWFKQPHCCSSRGNMDWKQYIILID